MGIFDSFRKPAKNTAPAHKVKDGASLQILLGAPLSDDFDALQTRIRAHASVLKAAQVNGISTGPSPDEASSFLAEVSWGAHAVRVVAFPLPMPAEVVETSVAPAHYGAQNKTEIRAHKAHALLYYDGQSTNKLEQFVAVAVVAGALCGESGLAILNENARTSLPAGVITSDMSMKPSEFWRTLPPLYLFAGFVKYGIQNAPGVWMRTHGLETFGLPNLATLAEGYNQSEKVFDIFNDIVAYMMEQGPVLAAGHTMQISEDEHMRLRELDRAVNSDEMMLDDGEPILVAEFISAAEINPHIFGSEKTH